MKFNRKKWEKEGKEITFEIVAGNLMTLPAIFKLFEYLVYILLL